VRSFEQTKSQVDFEALTSAIGGKIQRTTSVEDALQTAVRELGVALGATRVRANIAAASQNVIANSDFPVEDENRGLS